jgi:hypothetical protein
VIDLGLVPRADRPVPGRPAGARSRALRGWWSLRRRRVRAGLAGGLVAVLLSGSAGALPPRVSIRLPPAGDGIFEVVGDLVFVVESRTRWGAYDLATGQRRWSLERSGAASVGLAVSGDVLVDRRYGWGRGFDPATGQVRWAGRQDRGASVSWSTFRVAAGAGDGLVAGYHWSTPDGLAHRYTVLDLATGAVRWEALPESAVQVELAGDPPRVVTVDTEGRVQVRSPATGRVLASRRLPGLAGRARVPAGVQVTVVAGRLVLASPEPDGLVLHGYAVDSLAAQWRLAVPAGPDGARWRSVQRCGPMLCVGAAAPVVDPVAGRVAWWAGPDRPVLQPVGEWLLVGDRRGELRALVDARTGRTVWDLSGWWAVPPASAAPDRLLLTRPAAGSRTRVAGLDLATLARSDLGLLPGRPEQCRPYHSGLVCRHHDRLWVWPLPG